MSTPYYKNKIKTKINPISNKRYELSMYMYSGGGINNIKNSLIAVDKDLLLIEGEFVELIYDCRKTRADNKHLL